MRARDGGASSGQLGEQPSTRRQTEERVAVVHEVPLRLRDVLPRVDDVGEEDEVPVAVREVENGVTGAVPRRRAQPDAGDDLLAVG